jgi:hypothetical protein
MGIAQATPPALGQNLHFPVFGNFGHHFAGFGIPGQGPDGHLQDHIIAFGAGGVARSAVFSRFGNYVLHELQVEQGPQLLVSFQNHMAAPAAIAAIRPAFGVFLVSV